jgi:hypothetical protein
MDLFFAAVFYVNCYLRINFTSDILYSFGKGNNYFFHFNIPY